MATVPNKLMPLAQRHHTPEELRAAVKATVELCKAYTDIIKAAGMMGYPNGHLYTHVMDKVSLETHNRAVDLLKEMGVVKEINHCLFYVEPVPKTMSKMPSK